MTAMVLLVRHAHHDLVGRALVGRAPDVALSTAGLRQARVLAERLAGERIDCVQSSPRLRARQTVRPIANALELPAEIVPDLDDVDFGAWGGRTFSELESDPDWRRWNTNRATAVTPGGEKIRHVQRRMLRHLKRMRAVYPNGRLVIVSHAEPIRAAILHYRSMTLDEYASVTIDPASVTRLLVHERGGELVSENEHLDSLEPA